jgi:hypothetical protein
MSVDDQIQISQSNKNYIFSKSSNNTFKLFFDDIQTISYYLCDYYGNTIYSDNDNQINLNFVNLNYGLYYLVLNTRKETRIIKLLVIE